MNLFNYTWNQHFQFGYAIAGHPPVAGNVRWLSKRKNPNEIFLAKYGRSESVFPSWREANCEAARRILINCKELALRPLVLYSGGLDSEIVLLSFLEARKTLAATGQLPSNFEIDIATFRLTNNLNKHDIEYVSKFRSRLSELGHSELGLSFYEEDLDPLRYWQTDDFMQLARRTQTVSPIVVCQMWLCEQMLNQRSDYLPIIGQGEIHLVKQTPEGYEPGISPYLPSPWSIVETENLCGLYRFFIERGTPAVPGFFQYLPEQFESQLRTNRVLQELISTQRVGKLGTRSSKPEILAFDYPELERRPKYHGFETIEGEHDRMRKHLGTVMAECEGHWYKDVFALYRDVRFVEQASTGIESSLLHHVNSDLQFFLGQPGSPVRVRRVHAQDIFATEWRDPQALLLAWKRSASLDLQTASRQMTEAACQFLELTSKSHPDSTLFHDGSLLAQWFHLLLCKVRGGDFPIIDARSIPRLSPHEVCRDFFETDLGGDLDLYLQYKVANSYLESGDRFLILPRWNPRLHSEQVFQSGDSLVWLESEKEARLSASLHECGLATRTVSPWLSQKLATAQVSLMRAIHGCGRNHQEGAPQSWRDWLELQVANTAVSLKDVSQLSLTRYEAAKHRLQGLVDQIPHPTLPYMNSATVLSLPPDLELRRITRGLSDLRSVLAKYDLEEISLSEWILIATHANNEFRLGGNLFYRQTIRGLDLLSPNSRIAVGLRHEGKLVTSALIQILDPDSPEKGTLRIRAVTTDSLSLRKGFARALVQRIVDASDESLAAGFSAIQVWAAPEIVSAFLAAGFKSSDDLLSRAELVHDVKQDRLVESGRLLKPLHRTLGGTRL